MQLLTVVIPKLEQWQKEGEPGTKKINQWTRYVTVVLALLQSTGLVFLFHSTLGPARRRRHLPGGRVHRGEHRAHRARHDRRHGDDHVDGRAHHAARDRQRDVDPDLLERDLAAARRTGARSCSRAGRRSSSSILLIGLAIIVAVIFIEQGQRRIPVQYAKRVVGRRMTTGRKHLYPAEGEPVRRDPDHLRELGAVLPDAARQRLPRGLVPELREQLHHEPAEHRVHGHLRPARGVLRVLLHGDRVQPRGHGRQPPQVRRVRARASGPGRPRPTT